MAAPKIQSRQCVLIYWTVPSRTSFYEHLQESGYILVFKQTVSVGGNIKGNCDAELVLKTVSDFYLQTVSSAILITGDGDFGCLVEFLQKHKAIRCVISPDENKCSILLRNKNTEMIFLNNHYHKFSSSISRKEKAPDADVSA